jgi:hypothetical protein
LFPPGALALQTLKADVKSPNNVFTSVLEEHSTVQEVAGLLGFKNYSLGSNYEQP